MTLVCRIVGALLCLGWATVAAAQTFDVRLGEQHLGTMTYGAEGRMATVLDNTPLGVFDGRFDATSGLVRQEDGTRVRQYLGRSQSTRKTREISVLLREGQVVDVVINPLGERTDMSVVGAVTGGVVDPVAALGRLIAAQGCPGGFRIFDGRRVMQLSPTMADQGAAELICEMSYTVTDGPGHVSPLAIRSIDVSLTYDMSAAQALRSMRFRSGPFVLTLERQD